MNNKSYRIAFVVQGCIIIMLACISLFLRNEISSKDILIRQQELKLIDYALGISPSSVERLPVPAKPSTTMILNSNNNNNNNNNNAKSVSNLPSMHDLGMKTGTDKVTHHGYDRYYPMYLENLRTKPINMLEIGFLLGQSFEMWKLYFPLGNIYFMDKDCAKSHPKSRFCGDQGKVQDLQKMLSTKNITGNLDFIIDDGSHHPVHQIVSFTYLFEHGLKPGGIYIIEDIEMNYWEKGDTYGLPTAYGRDHPDSLITKLKTLVDVTNREYAKVPYTSSLGSPHIDKWVSSVFFGHNCVVITKMSEKEMATYGNRNYRYKDTVFK